MTTTTMLGDLPTTIVIKGLPALLDEMRANQAHSFLEAVDLSRNLVHELQRCMELSKIAYQSPRAGNADPAVQPIAFLSKNDTQAAIWKYGDRVYLVFRGTKGFEDLMDDIDIRYKRFAALKKVNVHAGFYRQWQDIFPLVDQELKAIKKKEGFSTLICTGHSLGGALATLATMEYVDSYPTLECYTFGSPRVGNLNFCDAFDQKVRTHWRVVNEKDPIPTFPFGPRFYHTSPGLCILKRGGVQAIPSDVPWYLRIFDPFSKINILKPGKEHESATYLARVRTLIEVSRFEKSRVSQYLI